MSKDWWAHENAETFAGVRVFARFADGNAIEGRLVPCEGDVVVVSDDFARAAHVIACGARRNFLWKGVSCLELV